ncbi:MAG: diguanylate cyclase [Myxococcota bacterium]|nr:diguanylate cyclase [Myxococcota bacterium]
MPNRATPPDSHAAHDSREDDYGVWRRPLGSLPTRLGFFVLGVTLCTALVISAISLDTTDAFLREKTQESFPVVLERTASELDTWYAARSEEAERFRHDPVLASYWNDLQLGGQLARRAREEIAEQLDRRLAGSDEFKAAFIVDAAGNTLLWRGAKVQLSVAMQRGLRDQAFSHAERWEGHGIQIASVRFGSTGTGAASLHLIFDLESLTHILNIHGRLLEGRISIIDGDRRFLASSQGDPLPELFELELPATGETLETVDTTGPEGERLIVSAIALPQHDWTLVIEEEYSRAYARVVSATRRVLGINLAIVALFALAAYRFAVKMVKPIEALSDAARRITAGEKNVSIPEGGSGDEITVLTRAFSEMTNRIETHAREIEAAHRDVERANTELVKRNDDLHRANEVLAQLSVTDGLTGLHNHRYFQDTLIREAKRVDRTGEPLSLVLIDIDHFKAWNDRLGHAAGDEILRRVAEVMQTLLRSTDLLARYGGEEFALLAPGTALEGATQLAEKMRATISETRLFIAPPSEHQRVTVSIGVALYRGDRKRLFGDADRALYRAKASGRDCVVVAEDDIEETTL